MVTILFSSCTNQEISTENNNNKIKVMVSILPQVTFVQEIGGNKVEVNEMIPPGFSPATYEPSPEQLKTLQNAEIYFRIGHIPFEKSQMEKLQNLNTKMQIVDTSEKIRLLTLKEHSHEEKEEHEHEESNDPHIWLSPQLVKIQAQHIYDTLVNYNPENKAYFSKNYNQFVKKLETLDQKLQQTFASVQDKTFLVFHPAFGYLAHDYGFIQKAIEVEGKDPSPKQVETIINIATTENIRVIFVQKQFSTKSAEAIAQEINGAVIQIDPLAKDYFTNLEKMSDTIVNAMTQ